MFRFTKIQFCFNFKYVANRLTCLRHTHSFLLNNNLRKNVLPKCKTMNLLQNINSKCLRTTHICWNSQIRGKDVKTVDDLFEFIHSGKQFYLKLLTNVLHLVNYDKLQEEDIVLLLQHCGSCVCDSSKMERDNTCQTIYNQLLENKKLTPHICTVYINTCTENHAVINVNEFLKSLPFEPTSDMWRALFKNSCNKGNTEQAIKLLELMKNNQIAIDEDIFNQLIFAHIIQGGFKACETVLETMKLAQINETPNTNLSILKGVIVKNNLNEFVEAVKKYSFKLEENHLLEVLEYVGLNGSHSWLPQILSLIPNKELSRQFFLSLEQICIHLIHMNQPESAMAIYRQFIKVTPDEPYGSVLLKEMLHCNIPVNTIILLGKQLRDEELNVYALEILTGIALRHNYSEQAWTLLDHLKEVRPHYFWPLLILSQKFEGEIGVMNTFKRIQNFNIKIDSTTFEKYVFPFCDLSNVKLVLNKFESFGCTIRELLSPLLVVLLLQNKTRLCANLCELYKVPIEGENFIKVLSSAWIKTRDTKSVVFILQKFCESNGLNSDYVGEFLREVVKFCKNENDFKGYLALLRDIREVRLKINSTSLETIQSLISSKLSDQPVAGKIFEELDTLLNYSLKTDESYIPHPRDMSIEELECHLIELREKDLETRGCLRRLIQLYSKSRNFKRMEELRNEFIEKGYKETPGMKSSLMHQYVENDDIEAALNLFDEIKTNYSDFRMDDFKVLDLAALLVRKKRHQDAVEILNNEVNLRKPLGGQSTERNCKNLLISYNDGTQQFEMFNFLVEKGFCQPKNTILGAIVKLHLNGQNLTKAVDNFVDLANKYKCTPMQLELILALLDEKNNELLQKVLDKIEQIHGALGVHIVLIAAFAEKQMEKSLFKLLVSAKIPVKYELKKRCERWVKERKLVPLQTLRKLSVRLSPHVIDLDCINHCILQIHCLNNDCNSAVMFAEELVETNARLSSNFETDLTNLLRKCNYEVPKKLNLHI